MKSKSHQRIEFHEITEAAIKDALAHPHTVDMKLVNAQQARRILDRLVGYKLSPLLWKKLSKRWLSAGRVQSVAVRLIVEREREIEKFKSVAFFTIDAVFTNIVAQLISKDGVKYESQLSFDLFDGIYTTSVTSIRSETQAKDIVVDFKSPFVVSSVDKKKCAEVHLLRIRQAPCNKTPDVNYIFRPKKPCRLHKNYTKKGLLRIIGQTA